MGAGQPTKASKQLAARIAKLIRNGTRMAEAAEQCGVDRSSLFNWLKWGEEGRAPFSEFASIVRGAVSEGKKPKQAG
jgi:transposase-like protein